MKNIIRAFFIAVLPFLSILTIDGYAASLSSSSSRPSYSSPSYSKPYVAPTTPSYSKPVTSTPLTVNTPSYSKPSQNSATSNTPSQTYSKPSSTPVTSSNNNTQTYVKPTTPLGIAQSKQVSSATLNSYKSERANAKTPPTPIDAKTINNDPGLQAARKQYGSTDQYMSQRVTNIRIYQTSHPDVFIYTHNMYPYYGAYDNSFLIGMMFGYLGSSASNANWMYAHQNDPWFNQWHQDMIQQAQTDANLQIKLAQMDQQLAQLKAQNAHPIVSALPEGVNASVAIAPEAMLVTAPDQPQSNFWSSLIFWFSLIFLVILIGGGYYLYSVGKKN